MMEKITWTPELSVGVAVFDEHHKWMILMINRLIDVQAEATNSEAVSDLLDRMTRYARDHLKAEEQMMAEHGYPQLAQHRAQQMAYIKKTADFCTATQVGVDGIPQGLLGYLRNWWAQHIQNTDKAYTAFFNGIGIT
jgi:hemerythrin